MHKVELTGNGNVYFYNMINLQTAVVVNSYIQAAQNLNALAGYPYTPAVSSAFSRVNTQAQANQFGPTNSVAVQVSGGGASNININISASVNPANDILIYIYNNGVTAMVVNDYSAYYAAWGTTLTIGANTLLS